MKIIILFSTLVLVVSLGHFKQALADQDGPDQLMQDTFLSSYLNQTGQAAINFEELKYAIASERLLLDSLQIALVKNEDNFRSLSVKLNNYVPLNSNLADTGIIKPSTQISKAELVKSIKSSIDYSFLLERKISEQGRRVRNLCLDSLGLKESLMQLHDSYCFDPFLNGELSRNSFRFKFKGKSYIAFIASNARHEIVVHHNDTRKLQPLEYTWYRIGRNKGNRAVAIMNAGMYNTTDGFPQGLLITQGKKIRDLDLTEVTKYGNFYLQPNGVFFVDSTQKFTVLERKRYLELLSTTQIPIIQATQSGPMLVINGNIHPAFKYRSTNLNIRNGVGIIKSSNRTGAVFLISEEPVNLYEFALAFQGLFQCDQALYLDGAISKMFVNETSNVLGTLGGELGPVISIHEK